MNKLRRAAAVAALVMVCMLAAAPALHAEGATHTPDGFAIFDAGGWLRGWLEWLAGFFERGSTGGGPPAGANGDASGCIDPNGSPMPCRQ
ncbi:MAG TPA: hypothetical protein VNJ70_01990 [Thermoanaerobaculia bacterium]|nr:hypothetical protein [Thermoanaerobaculia bacterium]